MLTQTGKSRSKKGEDNDILEGAVLALRRAIDLASIQRSHGTNFAFNNKTYRLNDVCDAMENQDAAEGAMQRSNAAKAEGSSVGCVSFAAWGGRLSQVALARPGIAKLHLNGRGAIT